MANFKTLDEFLRKYKSTNSKEASLCGMGKFKGSWMIPDDQYSTFLDIVHDNLFKHGRRPVNLVEQPRLDKPKPILVDMDFKFPEDTALTHRFTKDHIRTFVRSMVEGLDTFFDLTPYSLVRFFVSYRPQAYVDKAKKIVKDGIHIQCPDICLSNEKQKVLRAWLLDQEAIETSFQEIGYANENAEDIYDESMVRKQGWFLYGESKPDKPPYALASVFAYNPETAAMDEEDIRQYTPRELLELLSVRYNLAEDDNEVREDVKEEFSRLAKGRAAAQAPAAAQTAEAVGPAPIAPTAVKPLGVYIPDSYDGEEVELAQAIALQCLSVERADSYKTWMEVGWCLSNIEPSEEMFETWKQFSAKSSKSAGTDWTRLAADWARGFARNTSGAKLTLKSLHYWARQDNPEAYKTLVEEDHIRFVQYRVDDTHFHIARLLQRVYKGKFCASVESKRTEWYVFDERIHSWRHTNQGMELQEKLSTEMADLVVRARLRLKKKGWDAHCATNNLAAENAIPDEDWYKKWSMSPDGERFQGLHKVEKHLYQQDFKGGIMRAATELFHEEDFANKLNVNPNLFVCANGVLDLRCQVKDPVTGALKNKVIFREGRPDDYMSQLGGRIYPICDALDYIPYNPEDPKMKQLMDFLKMIFLEQDMLSYVVRLMASCLEGNNREQCYYTFIGGGGNGKSKVVDLMRYTFGEYCSSLQATALTRKRPDSGAANPDIISIKNKRFIYLQEPDDSEPLNTSRMKQFSGEDVVEARGLFEDQQRFRISGKLFMMCNKLPPVHSMDRGTWRRIRAIPFNSKFVDESDPELKKGAPNVFLRDNDLDTKLLEWRQAWLGLLVHVYETEYLVKGMEPVPKGVVEESNRYKESFDQYGKFKAERMVDFRDVRAKLVEYGNEEASLKDIMTAYTGWVRSNEGALTGKKLTKQDVQKRLEDDFGSAPGGVFKRCAVFFDDEAKSEFEKERAPDAS